MNDHSYKLETIKRALKKIQDQLEKKNIDEFEKENKEEVDAEWFNYARSYLEAAAELLLLIKKNDLLIITSLYNLRHGLELTIKAVYRFMDIPLEGTGTHDIKKLYKSLRNKMPQLLKKDINKFASNYKVPVEIIQRSNKNIIDKFPYLITKYYHNLPISKAITNKSFILQDIDNELFRYPETNKMKITFKMSSFTHKINKTDIQIISNDITDILRFLSLVYLLSKV